MPESKKSDGFQLVLRIGDLPVNRSRGFDVTATPVQRAQLADSWNIREIRKLRAVGELRPEGKKDWRLVGKVGATVVQTCVVTLGPVVTRIDEVFDRLFIAGLDEKISPEEIEIPDDVDTDVLPVEIDVSAIAAESVSLSLPSYPKAPGAELGDARFSAPGTKPLSDEDLRPFAGLAGLRDKLTKDD